MGGFARAMARIMNRVPAAVLRSPLHRLMSGRYLLLSFAGRKSGRRYTIPLAYLAEGDDLLMTTDSPWWRNLRRGEGGGGVPVTVRVGGRERGGTAEAVTDETEVARVLGRFLEAQPGYGRLGSRYPNGISVRQALQGKSNGTTPRCSRARSRWPGFRVSNPWAAVRGLR